MFYWPHFSRPRCFLYFHELLFSPGTSSDFVFFLCLSGVRSFWISCPVTLLPSPQVSLSSVGASFARGMASVTCLLLPLLICAEMHTLLGPLLSEGCLPASALPGTVCVAMLFPVSFLVTSAPRFGSRFLSQITHSACRGFPWGRAGRFLITSRF